MDHHGSLLFSSRMLDLYIQSLFQFIINEIDRTQRYKLQNCIFGGVWPGPKKPTRQQTLAMMTSVTQELTDLEEQHLYIVRSRGNIMMNLKVFVIGATCDKPAQALVQNTAEPIGKYGCGRCEIPGKTTTRFLKNFDTNVTKLCET